MSTYHDNKDLSFGMFDNGVKHYKFKDNLLVFEENERYKEVHHYNYKNGTLAEEKISVDGKLLQHNIFKQKRNGVYKYKAEDNSLRSTISLSTKGHITNATDDLFGEISTTYREIKGITFIKEQVKINGDNLKTISNTHTTGTWKGEEVIIEDRKLTKSGGYLPNEKRIYNLKGEEIYTEKFEFDLARTVTLETHYKYDWNGNWISKITYNLETFNVYLIEERQITYTDGITSGKLKNSKYTMLPPFRNQYFYKRDVTKNVFWFYDPSGKLLRKDDYMYIGHFDTNHYYYLDKTNGQLVELTNYKNLKKTDNYFLPAKPLSTGKKDYALLHNTTSYFILDGAFQDFGKGHIIKSSLIDSVLYFNQNTNKTYTYKACNQRLCDITLKPESYKNTYYYLYNYKKGDMIVKDHEIYQDGKKLDLNEYPGLIDVSKSYFKLDEENIIEIDRTKAINTLIPVTLANKDHFNQKLNEAEKLNNTLYVTKAYKEVIKNRIDKTRKKTPTETITQAQPTKGSNTPLNYGCNNNLNCLVTTVNTLYTDEKGKGKTDDEIAISQAGLIDQVYQNNRKLAYETLLKIKGNQMLKVLKHLSPEQRKYIREQSRKTVKEYTDKHGAPTIKTGIKLKSCV